jgi:ABC-type lipopolysaccharide export system ATPase subunit
MISGTASEIVNNPEAKRLYLGERFYMDTSPDERKSG